MNIKKILISPHKVKSREITKEDFKRVLKDAETMIELIRLKKVGVWYGGLALAHSQITKDDPLRFFVTVDGRIIINPAILRHVKYTNTVPEGCLTDYEGVHGNVELQRWHKCEVMYLELNASGNGVGKVKRNVTGKEAQVFQHEIEHMDAIYCFDHKKV